MAGGQSRYVLDYGRPRLAADGVGIVYERALLRADHAADTPAIRWARDVVPSELGLKHRGASFPAAPIALRRGRVLVWERELGIGLRRTR